MKATFNPHEWLKMPEKEEKKQEIKNTRQPVLEDNSFEAYLAGIEQSGIDLTDSYNAWRDLGFAISDEFGEAGRDYFHRISRNYPGYDAKECDSQYSACLQSKGHGITIATFYHYAHNAGIRLRKETLEMKNQIPEEKLQEKTKKEVPPLPETIFESVPEFLQRIIQPAESPEERDLLFLGALTAFSACFPNLFGIYDRKAVQANLYLFVTAPASAGKGRLNQIKNLVKPVHKDMREQAKMLKQQYEEDLASYNMNKKDENREKPGKPPERMLFIPANNSVTGVYQLISDNEGRGLIFETEGDTLAQAFKSDYGNYSDGFRKAFHHETISYYRRTDREYVDIEKPCLSTVLSGTPKQVATLVPDAENGLFSRFMFYYMNIKPVWKNVFREADTLNLDDYYTNLGKEFLEFYKTLKSNPPIEIQLTKEQKISFHRFFEKLQTKYLSLQPDDYIATVRRLGLIAFRLMMLFSVLRIMEDGDVNPVKQCEPVDFKNALACIEVLVKHSSSVFNELPREETHKKRLNRKERFLENLPEKFSRSDYLEEATRLKIPTKTAEAYITEFIKANLLHRESRDNYQKFPTEDF